MKRYIKNLIAALCGRNPFREELDEKNVQLDKAAANVQSLQDMYYSAVDRWNDAEKRSVSLQQLVENLRERIKEKDSELENVGRDFHERMEQMKQGYQKRIDEYNEEINKLLPNRGPETDDISVPEEKKVLYRATLEPLRNELLEKQ